MCYIRTMCEYCMMATLYKKHVLGVMGIGALMHCILL